MKPGKVLSLLYVFIGLFRGLTLHETGKILKVVMCAYTTNKEKHCDCAIHAGSMSIKQIKRYAGPRTFQQ